MIDKEDLERFNLLERKIEEGKATESEMYEREMLWIALEESAEEDNRHLYQFGC